MKTNILLFIILFYLLTPGILIKIKGNKHLIAIGHAILFTLIITCVNLLLNKSPQRFEYMTDASNVETMENSKPNKPKCPKSHVYSNGGLDSTCVECPTVNGLPLGVMGKYGLCAFSNSIDNRGYVETIEEGGICSDSLDKPVSIGNNKKRFCISNTTIKTSTGLDKFNKITTPSNIRYYQSI